MYFIDQDIMLKVHVSLGSPGKLWLEVSTTNHDPGVILSYYLKTVEHLTGNSPLSFIGTYFLVSFSLEGCLAIIRMDRGSENCKLAAAQYAFREQHNDEFSAEKSFRYGSSVKNTVRCTLFKQPAKINAIIIMHASEN